MLLQTPLFRVSLYIILIVLPAAVLPAAFLMAYVHRQDRVECEPPALLNSLVWRGVLAVLVSIVLEIPGLFILRRFVPRETTAYVLLDAFFVVATVEEGAKFFFLYRRTWRDPNFNYRYDAILYAVFVSLGFAAFENVFYVLNGGLSVALSRALLSIPGHMSNAVFMGLFYGRAKLYANRGNVSKCRFNLALSYLSALLFHGLYDTYCMLGTSDALKLFVEFVMMLFLASFLLIRHESKNDAPVQ